MNAVPIACAVEGCSATASMRFLQDERPGQPAGALMLSLPPGWGVSQADVLSAAIIQCPLHERRDRKARYGREPDTILGVPGLCESCLGTSLPIVNGICGNCVVRDQRGEPIEPVFVSPTDGAWSFKDLRYARGVKKHPDWMAMVPVKTPGVILFLRHRLWRQATKGKKHVEYITMVLLNHEHLHLALAAVGEMEAFWLLDRHRTPTDIVSDPVWDWVYGLTASPGMFSEPCQRCGARDLPLARDSSGLCPKCWSLYGPLAGIRSAA